MYVCICNALRQSQIEEMARSGVRCEREAYARLGCKPKCGVCLPVARALVQTGVSQAA
jgi:bacterioferritin-associated ferredoxin